MKKKTHTAERCRIDLLTFDGFDAQTKKFLYLLHFNNFYFRRQSPSQAAAAAMLEISMFFSFLSLPPLYPHHCTVDQYKWDHCYLFHIKWSLMFWLRNYFTHTHTWHVRCTVYIGSRIPSQHHRRRVFVDRNEIHFDTAEHSVLDKEPLNSAEYAQQSKPFRSNRGLGERGG